jgi:OOP family OmpA-OmpF porin
MDSIKLSAAAALVLVSIYPVTPTDAAESDNYLSIDAGLLGHPSYLRLGRDAASAPAEHELTWGFSVGHELNRFFALEAGYQDLGELSGSFAAGEGHFRFSARGPTFAMVGTIPFGKWAAYGKLGTMIANTHLSASGPDVPYSERDSWNVARMAELGIRYRITSQWDIGLAETAFGPLGQHNTTDIRRRATILAMRYHF